MTVWKSTPATITVLSPPRPSATNVPPTPSCSARIFKTLCGSKNTGTNIRRNTGFPKLPCPLPFPPFCKRGARGDLPGVHGPSLAAVLFCACSLGSRLSYIRKIYYSYAVCTRYSQHCRDCPCGPWEDLSCGCHALAERHFSE